MQTKAAGSRWEIREYDRDLALAVWRWIVIMIRGLAAAVILGRFQALDTLSYAVVLLRCCCPMVVDVMELIGSR